MKKWILGIAAAAVLLSVTNVPARAEKDVAHLAIGAGIFDVMDNNESGQFSLEYRGTYMWEHLRPVIGASVDTDGGLYGYGGLNYDFWLADKIVLTPNFVVGLYEDSDSKDLGGPLQFRSGIELGYELDDASRLSAAFNHISNASIYEKNPGAESAMLIYSLPVSF